MNKTHNSLIIIYLSHKGKKSSPDFQHHTGMMPKACRNFREGTGIIPEASPKLKQLTGKEKRNLLKTNHLREKISVSWGYGQRNILFALNLKR
jgi:hypothetical protein